MNMMRLSLFYLSISLIAMLLPELRVWAGPGCCSTGGYSPNIIQGDERALFSFGLDWSHKAAQSNSSGEIRSSRFEEDQMLGASVAASILASDFFQFGLDFSFARRRVDRNQTNASAWGARDLRLMAVYEALPQFTYDWWRPRAFVFSFVRVPLGSSMYDSNEKLQADALSEGFWSIGSGVFVVQNWGLWSANYTGSGRYRFDRSFSQANGNQVQAQPGWATAHQFSGTRRLRRSAWSFSSLLGWAWKSGVQTDDGIIAVKAGDKISTELGVSASYALSDTQALSLSYSDQSLIPLSQNSDLNRVVALNYNWGVFR